MAIFAGSTRRFSLALSPQNNPRLLYEGEAIKADGLNAIQASISKIGSRNNYSISLENAKAAARLRPLSRLRGETVKGSGTMEPKQLQHIFGEREGSRAIETFIKAAGPGC
ncbi:MAG: hypothetical protein CSA96_09530, partial [Bacteroidetes bacterium]